jgi:hypothetical protein
MLSGKGSYIPLRKRAISGVLVSKSDALGVLQKQMQMKTHGWRDRNSSRNWDSSRGGVVETAGSTS